MFEKLPRAYIISMRTSAWNVVLLMAVVMTVTGEEWYEQGHQNLLDWTNFDSTLQQPGKFKFVKFFTRNCRYCRLLKQVEEELQQERKWGFEFHSVDCSLHYDLCQAKAAMTAFPYVAIYNTHGKLHGTIGGYYPLDTMREAFNTIQTWQNAEILDTTGAPPPPADLRATQTQKTEESKVPDVKTEVKMTEPSVNHQEKGSESSGKKERVDEDDEGWGRSIRDGLKLTIILLGVIIFNKTVAPYLLPQVVADDFSKPRTIQIPVYRQAVETSKEDASECNKLVNDSI